MSDRACPKSYEKGMLSGKSGGARLFKRLQDSMAVGSRSSKLWPWAEEALDGTSLGRSWLRNRLRTSLQRSSHIERVLVRL